MKRHSDALAIAIGAVNPHGITLALTSALAECRAENLDTRATTHDPAIQLIVHQLAFICGLGESWPLDEWQTAKAKCELESAT